MLSDYSTMWLEAVRQMRGLNAPFGARCFLTSLRDAILEFWPESLNAPFGARCFLTKECGAMMEREMSKGLNAPFGARCFLTGV